MVRFGISNGTLGSNPFQHKSDGFSQSFQPESQASYNLNGSIAPSLEI